MLDQTFFRSSVRHIPPAAASFLGTTMESGFFHLFVLIKLREMSMFHGIWLRRGSGVLDFLLLNSLGRSDTNTRCRFDGENAQKWVGYHVIWLRPPGLKPSEYYCYLNDPTHPLGMSNSSLTNQLQWNELKSNSVMLGYPITSSKISRHNTRKRISNLFFLWN